MRTDPATFPLEVRLFGPFEVRLSSQPLPRLRFRKSQSVLALLALRQGCGVERDWLGGLLWPESSGTHALRNCLTDLRRALGPEARRLCSPTPRTLALDLTGASVDVLAFDAALTGGGIRSFGDSGGGTREAGHGAERSEVARAALEEAVALYRGPLLEGCAEAWAFQERQTREQSYLAALEQLAALARARGDWATAERCLRLAVTTDPLRETSQRLLMELLAAAGNYAAALLAYRELRSRLHRELNTEPDPETRLLFERLRDHARAGSSALLPPSAMSRSYPHAPPPLARSDAANGGVGVDRDCVPGLLPWLPLDEEDVTPPCEPQSVSVPEAGHPHNLPLQLTRLIGRQAEMAEIQQQLPVHRLVTLTGIGGSGKTRLALEVAARSLALFRDGAWLGQFASLAEPDLVPQTVAAALGIREQPDRPLTQTLTEALKPKQLLLVLDNCEHLVAASAQLAETLLRACPHLRLLVTSRAPLGIAGERTYRVPPLSLPAIKVESHRDRVPPAGRVMGAEAGALARLDRGDTVAGALPSPSLRGVPGRGTELSTIAQSEAVHLFAERAQAAQPGFTLTVENASAVAQVCCRLEGLPLALELAAARIPVLTPEQMLARLAQRFELLVGRSRQPDLRHRSLRATLDWSYQLLSPELQRFFARLSIFRGGWTLEAAEAVCKEPRALEYLEELQHCSLVITEAVGQEMRYRLLETLREYGAEQLGGEERIALAHAHLSYFQAQFEKREQGLTERVLQQWLQQWLDRAEREHDNLRSALDWMVKTGDGPVAEYFVANMGVLWRTRGYFVEGHQRMARILSLPGAAVPTRGNAWALMNAGDIAIQQGDFADGEAYVQKSLAMQEELGDKKGVWSCCQSLAYVALVQGDYARARRTCERVLAAAQEWGYESAEAEYFSGMGEIAYREGDLETAQAFQEKALRAMGDRAEMDPETTAWIHLTFGKVADARGDHPAARAHLEAGRALLDAFGPTPSSNPASVQFLLGRLAQHEGQWPIARANFARWLTVCQQQGDTRGIAECLEGLAAVASGRGEPERAARLLGAAAALRRRLNVALPAFERADLDHVVVTVRADIGDEAFAAAWAEGKAMPVEAAIAEALQEMPAS